MPAAYFPMLAVVQWMYKPVEQRLFKLGLSKFILDLVKVDRRPRLLPALRVSVRSKGSAVGWHMYRVTCKYQRDSGSAANCRKKTKELVKQSSRWA